MSYPTPQVIRRVLMTADCVGGVWTHALALCRELGKRGVEVLLATMGAALSDAQVLEARGIENLQISSSNLRLEWMQDPWEDVDESGRWLQELEQAFQPDIIHLNGYAHGALQWGAPVVVVGHSCVFSWWRAVRGEAPPNTWTTYHDRVQAGVQCADLVVAPTGAMLQSLEDHYGTPRRKQVIYNGCDPARFHISRKEDFILAAGRVWDPGKNIAALSHVAPRLSWPVWIAGETTAPDGSGCRLENVRSLGLLSAEQLAACYAKAAIYALPAIYEPFGLSILEAALSGCALVIGDTPSLREVWSDRALFVPPSDASTLQRALIELSREPERRRTFARRAWQRAQELNSKAMADSYLSAYHVLLRERGLFRTTEQLAEVGS